MSAEQIRLDEARDKKAPWKKWGPYLSERQWGTVREDYAGARTAWPASMFLKGKDGLRPVYGGNQTFQNDPRWRDYVQFYEYFHGDNGAGLGANHQTGWDGVCGPAHAFLRNRHAGATSPRRQDGLFRHDLGVSWRAKVKAERGPQMIMQFLYALGLTGATVLMHGLGTLEAIAHLSHVWQRTKGSPGSFVSLTQVLRVVSVLLLLHFVEAAIWAGFYLAAGALPDIETATYFSLTSYTTLGYGDVVLPVAWRLLGPFEAAVGILMFGWSTGIMVAVITRIYGRRLRLLTD